MNRGRKRCRCDRTGAQSAKGLEFKATSTGFEYHAVVVDNSVSFLHIIQENNGRRPLTIEPQPDDFMTICVKSAPEQLIERERPWRYREVDIVCITLAV